MRKQFKSAIFLQVPRGSTIPGAVFINSLRRSTRRRNSRSLQVRKQTRRPAVSLNCPMKIDDLPRQARDKRNES
eukprot:COSAG06_NODE_7069_length_2647_cov_4.568681_5_plen_74_part_00